MAIYLTNIALIIFWRLCITKRRFKDSRKLYCGLVAFQWILVSGLRDWSVGADTYHYYDIFERAKQTPWGTAFGDVFDYLFRGLETKDPGYTLLTKIFQIFSGNYQVFLLAIAALFMSLMAVWIYRHSASPCTSFIIFSTLFYEFYAVTGHRQTIATALIVFYGYELIRKRDLLKFAIVAFIAFLIHKSSLVFVPFYFLTMIPVTKPYVLVCAVAIAAVVVLGERLFVPVAEWMGFGSEVIDYDGGGAGLFSFLMSLLSIVILLFYPKIKARRSDADHLFHAATAALLSSLLVVQLQSFMRVQQYFSLFIMISVPELFNVFKKEYRLLAYLGFGIVMIGYLILKNPYYSLFFMN